MGKKETRIFVAQILMGKEWSDTSIKGEDLDSVRSQLELNKDHYIISKCKQRIIERLTTVLEFLVDDITKD